MRLNFHTASGRLSSAAASLRRDKSKFQKYSFSVKICGPLILSHAHTCTFSNLFFFPTAGGAVRERSDDAATALWKKRSSRGGSPTGVRALPQLSGLAPIYPGDTFVAKSPSPFGKSARQHAGHATARETSSRTALSLYHQTLLLLLLLTALYIFCYVRYFSLYFFFAFWFYLITNFRAVCAIMCLPTDFLFMFIFISRLEVRTSLFLAMCYFHSPFFIYVIYSIFFCFLLIESRILFVCVECIHNVYYTYTVESKFEAQTSSSATRLQNIIVLYFYF